MQKIVLRIQFFPPKYTQWFNFIKSLNYPISHQKAVVREKCLNRSELCFAFSSPISHLRTPQVHQAQWCTISFYCPLHVSTLRSSIGQEQDKILHHWSKSCCHTTLGYIMHIALRFLWYVFLCNSLIYSAVKKYFFVFLLFCHTDMFRIIIY